MNDLSFLRGSPEIPKQVKSNIILITLILSGRDLFSPKPETHTHYKIDLKITISYTTINK